MVNINVCYDHGKDLNAFDAWKTIKEINLLLDDLIEKGKEIDEVIEKHEQKLKEE